MMGSKLLFISSFNDRTKKLIKPFYLGMFSIINKIYFNIFITCNRDLLKRRNTLCKTLPGERILILAPHIDDEVIGCGGAILKYLRNKKNVFIAYLTDSSKLGSKLRASEIIEERRMEALLVGKEIGIDGSMLFFLNGEDKNLINSNIEESLKRVVLETNPDVIFIPCLLDTHIDHYAATKKLCNLYEDGLDVLQNTSLFLFECQSPLTSFYSNICLDVTDVFDQKKRLLKLYASQSFISNFVLDLNKLNGMAFGKGTFCELFYCITFNKYYDFYIKNFRDYDKYLDLKKKLIRHSDARDLIRSYKSSLIAKTMLKNI